MDELSSLKDNQPGMDEMRETVQDSERERGCVWSGMLVY